MSGAAFKEWRDRNALSLTQCAKLLQVSRATILRWQKRGTPKMERAARSWRALQTIKDLPRFRVPA